MGMTENKLQESHFASWVLESSVLCRIGVILEESKWVRTAFISTCQYNLPCDCIHTKFGQVGELKPMNKQLGCSVRINAPNQNNVPFVYPIVRKGCRPD